MPSLNKNHRGDRLSFIWCLLFLSQFTAYKAFAQVKYAFTRDTVTIKGGQTFANMLQVTNPYQQDVVLLQDAKGKKLPKGMLSLPDTLLVKAGETRRFPLKYLADRQTISSNAELFSVTLIPLKAGVQVQSSAKFLAQMTEISGLTLGTEDDEIYLGQLNNQAQVVVRVANNGFIPLTFRILLTGIPDGLEFTGQTMNLTLQPGTQQLLPFIARNKSLTAAVDFTVTMQALDQSNNQLAVKVIRILNVTSARRMSGGSPQNGGALANTVSLNFASLNRNSSYYQLQANGKVNLGGTSSIDYRVNADDYHQEGANGINVYNSYLDFESKRLGLKVGNVFDNLDFQLAGKGVKASVKLDDQGIISLYGVENNYFIYNEVSRTPPGARVYALDYDLKNGASIRKLTFLHSEDPFTGLEANQASTKANFVISKFQTIGFEGGFSMESPQNNRSDAKRGFSGGLNYGLRAGNYHYQADGYYSSPYFTGLRRGLFLADVRITRKIGDEGNLSAHINLQSNNPKFQYRLNDMYNLGVTKNVINIYELAYGTRAGSLSLNFGPYFMDQHLISNGFSAEAPMPTNWKSSSFRFLTNIGYNAGLNNFSVIGDYGYTFINSSGIPPAPFHSIKVTASYNRPIVGFTGYMQLNPFYLSDALSAVGNDKYRLYSAGPNLHFTTLRNTLNLQLSGMYNYYGFTRSANYSASGSIRYLLKGHWAITADGQYIVTKQKVLSVMYSQVPDARNYDQLSLNNRQFRVGIEKQFGGGGDRDTKKLTLAYFEDHNSNGVRDAGEDVLPGVLVKIKDNAALTNSKGEVTFSGMKKEVYSVSITNTKGWSLAEATDVFLDKSKRVEVPLVKTQALNGLVKPIASKYLNGKPALAGIRVTATDASGREHQTMTDDQGGFCFYLPRNTYTVTVNTEGMPFSIENGREEVVLQGKPVELLTFLYKDERRKVGVTRF